MSIGRVLNGQSTDSACRGNTLLPSFLEMVGQSRGALGDGMANGTCSGIGPEISQSVKDIYSAAGVRCDIFDSQACC